jgi:hypothetical protein
VTPAEIFIALLLAVLVIDIVLAVLGLRTIGRNLEKVAKVRGSLSP